MPEQSESEKVEQIIRRLELDNFVPPPIYTDVNRLALLDLILKARELAGAVS